MKWNNMDTQLSLIPYQFCFLTIQIPRENARVRLNKKSVNLQNKLRMRQTDDISL
jgi:hypothetical protein